MQIKDKIKELRQSENLTQKQLADVLNITQDSISLWEKGKRLPDTQYLTSLADYFKVSLDYLFGRSDDFGNIALPSEFLSEREKELVKNYRALSDSKKELIDRTIATCRQAEDVESRG